MFAEGQEFYKDIKTRAVANGRSADQVLVLPGLVPILGSTEAEAKANEEALIERMIPAYGLRQLSHLYGRDLTGIDLDSPLPEVPVEDDIEGHKSRTTLITKLARGEDPKGVVRDPDKNVAIRWPNERTERFTRALTREAR